MPQGNAKRNWKNRRKRKYASDMIGNIDENSTDDTKRVV